MSIQKALHKKALLLLILIIFLSPFKSFSQFFDFDNFYGSPDQNTFPKSALGKDNVTLKTLEFSGDTLWAGTYRDGFYKWWNYSLISADWWGFNNFKGNETYNLGVLKADKIFFTDFNSFTNEYNGVFRLDNKDDLTDPIITKLIYAGTDTLNSPLINQVHDIEILGDSLVLFATDSGMVFFDGEKRWRTRSPKTNPIIDQWKIDQVSANSKGEFFMASGGIVYYENNDAWQKVDLTIKPYKLKNAQVKSIKKGTNDTMWVVTNLAVIKIINDSIIVWKNDEIKTLLNEVKDVAFDSIGNPWMIFELNGGIKFIDESTGEKVWRYINSTNSDLPDELSCVAADGNGRMWFGTDNSGLFKYKGFTPGSIGAQWPKDILLYPTLTSNGTVNINNTSNQTYSLELINLQGQTIGNFNLYNNQHHQLFLRPGTYILQANNGNTVSTKKIIVLGN